MNWIMLRITERLDILTVMSVSDLAEQVIREIAVKGHPIR